VDSTIKKRGIGWWLIIYTIIFASLEAFAIAQDFVGRILGYDIILHDLWSSAVFTAIVFGNLAYALRLVAPTMKRLWRPVPFIIVVDAVFTGCLGMIDPDLRDPGLMYRIILVAITMAFYIPSIVVHFRIAYRHA
jgi:hypothetical protein